LKAVWVAIHRYPDLVLQSYELKRQLREAQHALQCITDAKLRLHTARRVQADAIEHAAKTLEDPISHERQLLGER